MSLNQKLRMLATVKKEGWRVQGWVDTQPLLMEATPQQQQPLYTGPAQQRVLHMSPTQPTPGENGHQLDPLALVFRPDPPQGAQKAVSSTVIEEMVHSLHTPKVEIMTFDGEPMKFWTFVKSFDNNADRHNVDQYAKIIETPAILQRQSLQGY